MTFGKRLRELREKSGYTQKDFAIKIGLTKDLYNKYENDKTRPSFETLDLICSELNTTTDYLMGRSNIKTPITEELSIPEDFNNAKFAFHRGDIEGLTQDEVDKISEYIKFVKSQRK